MEKKIIDLAKEVDAFDDGLGVYIPHNIQFNLNDSCFILPPDDESDLLAKKKGYYYVFGLYVISEILDNLKQQIHNPTDEQIMKAIRFYYENDAFIEI